MIRTPLALALLLAANPAAGAQSGPDAGAQPGAVEALLLCRDETEADARLACLDAALAEFDAALETGRLAVVERRQVREVERESFGLTLPSVSGLGTLFARRSRDAAPDEPDAAEPETETLEDGAVVVYARDGGVSEIRSLPVAQVTETRAGLLVITLENGQVWRQTSPSMVRTPRRNDLDGLTARIESGVLGAYFMELSHHPRRFRAERVD
ncbi:MAG: hypothetical protein ACFE0P_01150 [Oceanicaulis sp.]